MHKVLAGSLVVAGLAAGSVGVAALNPLGVATAAIGGQTKTADVQTVAAQAADPSTTAPPAAAHKSPLDQVLDDLVAKGTITQAQADAVRNGVDAKRKELGQNMGPGMRLGGGAGMMGVFGDVAKQLGMTPQDLLTELRSGKSLADVAKAKGLDEQKVIDSLVSAADARIDQAVKDGKLAQDKADTMKAKLPDRIKALVEHQGFKGGHAPGTNPPTSSTLPSN